MGRTVLFGLIFSDAVMIFSVRPFVFMPETVYTLINAMFT